jgi:Mg2+ and Co2+ transporter CorA
VQEAYLQLTVTLTNELESLDAQLHSAEALMNMKSDNLRNRILYINMITTTVTMAVTMAVVVSAFFGMNVPIDLYESDPGVYFKPVLIWSVVGAIIVAALLFLLLRRIGILTTAV